MKPIERVCVGSIMNEGACVPMCAREINRETSSLRLDDANNAKHSHYVSAQLICGK